MPLDFSKNGFLLLKDTETGYVNYSVLFEAAECDINGLFGTMDYFAWDVFEEGEPKSLEHHIRQGNVKIINGDLYFKNPDAFTEHEAIFVDILLPHIVPRLYFAQHKMFNAFTNGRPLILALAEDGDGLENSIRNKERSDKQTDELEKYRNTIGEFNMKVLNILTSNCVKYGAELHFVHDEA